MVLNLLNKSQVLCSLGKSISGSLLLFVLLTFTINLLPDRNLIFPLKNRKTCSWSQDSFWFYPWGKSKIHKGVDIFTERNEEIISPVRGFVIEKGFSPNGGNFIYIFGGDCRIYYFAHLELVDSPLGTFVIQKQVLGYIGDSGNAKYSPCHLHFSVFSMIPILKEYDNKAPEGWKKMFYLNPASLWKTAIRY